MEQDSLFNENDKNDLYEFLRLYDFAKVKFVDHIVSGCTRNGKTPNELFHDLYSLHKVYRFPDRADVAQRLRDAVPNANDEDVESALRGAEMRRFSEIDALHALQRRCVSRHASSLTQKTSDLHSVAASEEANLFLIGPTRAAVDEEMTEECRRWMSLVLGDRFNTEIRHSANFVDALRNGVLLLVLLQKLQQPPLSDDEVVLPRRVIGFYARDNVISFLKKATKTYDLVDSQLFTDTDLCDAKNDRVIVTCILAIAQIAYARGLTRHQVRFPLGDREKNTVRWKASKPEEPKPIHPSRPGLSRRVAEESDVQQENVKEKVEGRNEAEPMASTHASPELERRGADRVDVIACQSESCHSSDSVNGNDRIEKLLNPAMQDDLVREKERHAHETETNKDTPRESEELERQEAIRKEEEIKRKEEQRQQRELEEELKRQREWELEEELRVMMKKKEEEEEEDSSRPKQTNEMPLKNYTNVNAPTDWQLRQKKEILALVSPTQEPLWIEEKPKVYAELREELKYHPRRWDDLDLLLASVVNTYYTKRPKSEIRFRRLTGNPGEYVVYHRMTGNKKVVNVRISQTKLMIRPAMPRGSEWSDFRFWLNEYEGNFVAVKDHLAYR